MKTRKTMLSLVTIIALIFTMSFAVSVTAFAASDGEISVSNAIPKEEYTLYKVFDATTKAGRTDGGTGISYSSTWLTTSNDYFAVDSKGNITIKDAGKNSDGTLSDAAIAWLKTQVSKFTKIGDTITANASGNNVKWTGLADGYYYVTTTTGSFISVDSIKPTTAVQEKNSLPTHDKKQSATQNGTYSDNLLELNIGDTVYYQVAITDGKGTDKKITYVDSMSDGLTFDPTSITVKKGNDTVAESNYTLTASSNSGFTLELKADYVATLGENDVVTVAYSATINEKAVINSATGNSNTASLQYSNQDAVIDVVYVATYDFQLKKVDENNEYLSGSGFKLYDAETGGNLVAVAKDTTGYYKNASGVEIMVDSSNGVNVRGLAPGTYWLEETTTPDGYNTLTGRKSITISAGQTATPTCEVINEAGTELPGTGGMGTTIIYIIGAALIIGCAVVLISRRRAHNK